MSKLMYGAQSRRAFQEIDRRKKISDLGGDRHFFLKPGEEARVTFLDGELYIDGDEKGFFKNPSRYEHQVWGDGGPPQYFACTAEKAPCPICRANNRAYLATYFTVIDHRVIKGQRATYKNRKILYVAKHGTVQRLRRLAAKNKGSLRGISFEISRSGERSATVGDEFMILKRRSSAQLVERVRDVWTDAKTSKPIPYDQVLVYHTAKKLKKMGVGEAAKSFRFEGRKRGRRAGRNIESQI